MVRKICGILVLLALVFSFAFCGSSEGAGTENGVYSRYNLHYVSEKGVNKGSFLNFTDYPGHQLLPYNTKIKVSVLNGKQLEIVTDKGVVIIWEYASPKAKISADEYINLITSTNPVKYEKLSDVDRQGIEAGKALPGMSKQGVMVALGYPAKHMTPSLDANQWTYWKGRRDSYIVEFDSNGKVVSK